VDNETEYFGHINVDEIEEVIDSSIAVADFPIRPLLDHRCRPNPCNPTTEILYTLNKPGRVQVLIHDLRGRAVWHSPVSEQEVGPHGVRWDGRDIQGHIVGNGVYLYSIELEGETCGSGKIAVVK
jgi:hypothetical protein